VIFDNCVDGIDGKLIVDAINLWSLKGQPITLVEPTRLLFYSITSIRVEEDVISLVAMFL
jgi:hypothetical protein